MFDWLLRSLIIIFRFKCKVQKAQTYYLCIKTPIAFMFNASNSSWQIIMKARIKIKDIIQKRNKRNKTLFRAFTWDALTMFSTSGLIYCTPHRFFNLPSLRDWTNWTVLVGKIAWYWVALLEIFPPKNSSRQKMSSAERSTLFIWKVNC